MSANTDVASRGGPASVGASCAGKYLTFRLGTEVYGIGILKVQEIIGLMAITYVPRAPKYMRGVINLRGKVIPVVDLRARFDLEPVDDTSRTCIIVVQVSQEDRVVTVGLVVDEVSEVIDISAEQIEPRPSFGSQVETDFILGMGKLRDIVVMLLGIDQVLSSGTFHVVQESSEAS